MINFIAMHNYIGPGLFVRSYSSLLTNVQKNSFSVSPNLHEIIIGLSLGGGGNPPAAIYVNLVRMLY
jgi:hypothetical protein